MALIWTCVLDGWLGADGNDGMSGGGEEEATHEGLLYWDFKGATFFSFTIVTTIGFGYAHTQSIYTC